MKSELTNEQIERIIDTINKALDLARKKYGFSRKIHFDDVIETLGKYDSYKDDWDKEQKRLNIRELAEWFGQAEAFCQLIDRREKTKLNNRKVIKFDSHGGRMLEHVVW